MTPEEQTARQGLDIASYPFTWRYSTVHEISTPRTDESRLLPYWERVRLTFLELGGGCSDGRSR